MLFRKTIYRILHIFCIYVIVQKVNRHSQTDAIVLNTRQVGESNRLVTLLTREDGLVRAVLYGGSKSRLRSLVSPYHSGIVWLYKNNQKESIKISDFDAKHFYLSIREELYKSWAASVCAEVLITTHSGGEAVDFNAAFTLVNGFFTGLDLVSNEFECRMGLVRFLWRYLDFLGLQPESHYCIHCGSTFLDVGDFKTNPPDKKKCSFYSPADSGFICTDCARDFPKTHHRFGITDQTRSYLEAIVTLLPSQVRKLPVTDILLQEMQGIIFYLIEKACGTKLKTLI